MCGPEMPGLASLRGVRLKQPTIGTAMTNSMHRALIATLGAVTLMFAAGETSARSGAVQGTSVAAARAMVHPAPGRAFITAEALSDLASAASSTDRMACR